MRESLTEQPEGPTHRQTKGPKITLADILVIFGISLLTGVIVFHVTIALQESLSHVMEGYSVNIPQQLGMDQSSFYKIDICDNDLVIKVNTSYFVR